MKEELQEYSARRDSKKVVEYRMQADAYIALQHACEMYLTGIFENTASVAEHSNRYTIQRKDVGLVMKIKNNRT